MHELLEDRLKPHPNDGRDTESVWFIKNEARVKAGEAGEDQTARALAPKWRGGLNLRREGGMV